MLRQLIAFLRSLFTKHQLTQHDDQRGAWNPYLAEGAEIERRTTIVQRLDEFFNRRPRPWRRRGARGRVV